MTRFIAVAIFLIAGTCTAQTTIEATFDHDGLTRDYILYLPANLESQAPLVFNLHGYTSNAEQQRFYSEMDGVADANGFAVCYPNGTLDEFESPFWNSGWGGGVDDTGFLVALAQALQEEYDLDPERTFSCGMSNGGFMSYHLACAAYDTFKAVASVTGTMSTLTYASCDPPVPVPAFEIHGTLDLVVPYDGGDGMVPIVDVVDFWANINGCGSPDVYELDNINLLDFSTVTVTKYADCTSGNEVWLYTVEAGGHTWPGAIPIIVTGNTNQDFDASEEIWNFFAQCVTPTSVEEEMESSLMELYPNPSEGQLCGIEGKFELWSMTGQLVYRSTNDAACITLPEDISGMHIARHGNDLEKRDLILFR